MDFWRSTPSPDLYLPVFSLSVSQASNETSPLVALKKSCFNQDSEQDHLSRFPSPVDEQDADLLLHFATSPLSHKTPASSRSSAHTPTSQSTSSGSRDGGRHTTKRALSPFTPQDFDKAYPLQYNISPLSVSPVIRTSSPDYDPLDPSSPFYFSFKRRCLRRVPETPQKSSPGSGVDELSPLSSISSISDASSGDSPLASRSHSSIVRASVSPSPSPEMVASSSRISRVSRRSIRRRSLSSPRALGSPAYRRRKLESLAISPEPLRSQIPRVRLRSRLVRVFDDCESDKSSGRKRLPALRLPPISNAAHSVDDQNTKEHPQDEASSLPLRTFPPEVKMDHRFSLFYIRYPIYSCSEGEFKRRGSQAVSYNEPRSPLDLYTPRFVRGIGGSKEGLCPLCYEPTGRGGQGKKEWLKTKVSAFKCYHMQYFHGICGRTGRPFSPPIEIRTFSRQPANPTERAEIKRGKCHKCSKWIDVEGIKDVSNKVKELFWWKHAFSCHQGSIMEGETDIFIEDKFYTLALKEDDTTDTEL